MGIWIAIGLLLLVGAIAGIPLLLKKHILPPTLPPMIGPDLRMQARRKEVLTMRHIGNQITKALEPVAKRRGFKIESEIPNAVFLQVLVHITPARPRVIMEEFLVDIQPGRVHGPIRVNSNGEEILSLPLTKEEVGAVIHAGLEYMGEDPA